MTKEQDQLFREWLKAYKVHHDKLNEYIFIDIDIAGRPARLPIKLMSKEIAKELDDLGKKMNEKWNLWIKSLGL